MQHADEPPCMIKIAQHIALADLEAHLLRLDTGMVERLDHEITPMITETRDWTELVLEAIAPERAATAELGVFLSMSGALWIDEMRLVRSPLGPFDDKKVREAAIDALSGYMLRTYPFFGYRGKPTHAKVFKKLRAKAIKAKSIEDMAAEIKEAFDDLEDLHLKLRVHGDTVRTGPRGNPNPTNWNFDAVAEHFERVVSEGDTHVVAKLKENVGYVRLGSFSAEDAEIEQADRAMDELSEVTGWIFDVRPNGGGSESQGEYFAARFVSENVEYARQVYRDAFAIDDETAFTGTSSRWIQPREGRTADERPVVVLMGPYCVSSTEGYLFMMDALPNATLVGKPSRGSSANPRTYVVVPGLEVVVPRWRAMTLEDECIEGVGIQPDVVVDQRPSKYLKADPTFERGLELLVK